MKKIIIILVIGFLFSSCESESDSDCDGPLLTFKNGTNFSITLIINGKVEKTISAGQTHLVRYPSNSITYSAAAGNHRWGKTITLDDCDAKSITLTV
ncbi:hypothetical protein SAMN05216503_2664 [Polaribacter sp. KT25b]|uniref:hypothetical protein n=1 Tax=Polaribacter sp. KT25b TaxID=1855336 RepID=UPI000879B550|nr:hypothetical protein [Polaribacter sp. KT25b]SDS31497.1 hypothetical protein SAMN05216503_2664 [Polaribacter sp. KT25b]